jgi:hypothetical protein
VYQPIGTGFAFHPIEHENNETMRVKIDNAGFNARKRLAADRKQREAETERKALSAKRCKELGVTGPDDPLLLPKIELAMLRKDVDALSSEFNALNKSVENDRSQLAKVISAGSLSQSRAMQRPREMTRTLRSR